MHEIKCGEIWGGIRGQNLEAVTGGVRASLFSSAARSDRGGDIYYFSVCNNDLLTRVAIADVVGHGETVARTSQWLYESLESRMDSADGSEVLKDLNHLVVEHGYQALTTAAIAAFYRESGQIMFSYAGHHPVMVRRGGNRTWSELSLPRREGLANLPLGVAEDVDYDQSQAPLASGSQFVLYTDGVVEARNGAGEFFGMEGLRSALDDLDGTDASALKRGVMSRLLDHAGNTLEHDDVTLIVVEVK